MYVRTSGVRVFGVKIPGRAQSQKKCSRIKCHFPHPLAHCYYRTLNMIVAGRLFSTLHPFNMRIKVVRAANVQWAEAESIARYTTFNKNFVGRTSAGWLSSAPSRYLSISDRIFFTLQLRKHTPHIQWKHNGRFLARFHHHHFDIECGGCGQNQRVT